MRRWSIPLAVCLCGVAAATAEGAPAPHAAKTSIPAVGRYGGGPRDAPGHQYELGVYVAKIKGKSAVSVGSWIKPQQLTCSPAPFTVNGGDPFVQKFFGLKVSRSGSFKGSVVVFGLPNTISGKLSKSKVNVTIKIDTAELQHTCTGTVHFNVTLKKQRGTTATPI
jgi:hypothetical protein